MLKLTQAMEKDILCSFLLMNLHNAALNLQQLMFIILAHAIMILVRISRLSQVNLCFLRLVHSLRATLSSSKEASRPSKAEA